MPPDRASCTTVDQRYLSDPYEFVKPYRSTAWCRAIWPIYRWLLKRSYQIDQVELRGLEHFRQAMAEDAGIFIAPNHARYSDPFLMGEVTKQTGRFLYFCASWHLFKTKKWQGRIINRMGAMSIYREGSDRECLKECQRIVEENERPLILFPEGTFYRQNDRLGPLQDGVAFLARRASKKSTRPIVVIPVAIKYWFTEDPTHAIEKRLCQLEQRCHLHPKRGRPYAERLKRIGTALLVVKEIELLGEPQKGDLDTRQATLAEFICNEYEMLCFGRVRAGNSMDRIRGIRNHVVKKFTETPKETPEWYELLYQIEDLAFAQQLCSHSWKYIDDFPSMERISETIMRLEEDLYDEETPMGMMGVVVEFDAPIRIEKVDEPEGRRNREDSSDPLTRQIAERIQKMLDGLVHQGPPPSWNCPAVRPFTGSSDQDSPPISPAAS